MGLAQDGSTSEDAHLDDQTKHFAKLWKSSDEASQYAQQFTSLRQCVLEQREEDGHDLANESTEVEAQLAQLIAECSVENLESYLELVEPDNLMQCLNKFRNGTSVGLCN